MLRIAFLFRNFWFFESHKIFLMIPFYLDKGDRALNICCINLKGLPLEKLSPFFIADLPKTLFYSRIGVLCLKCQPFLRNSRKTLTKWQWEDRSISFGATLLFLPRIFLLCYFINEYACLGLIYLPFSRNSRMITRTTMGAPLHCLYEDLIRGITWKTLHNDALNGFGFEGGGGH